MQILSSLISTCKEVDGWGTHIISNRRQAHSNVANLNIGIYIHSVVVYERNFIDPVTKWYTDKSEQVHACDKESNSAQVAEPI